MMHAISDFKTLRGSTHPTNGQLLCFIEEETEQVVFAFFFPGFFKNKTWWLKIEIKLNNITSFM